MLNALPWILLTAGILVQQDAPRVELEPLEPIEPVEALEPVEVKPAKPARTAPSPQTPETPKQTFAPGTELRVSASSLALRSSPDRSGPLIYYIEQHDPVTVIGDTDEPVAVTIGGKTGVWTRVTHKGRTGYVFGAYLEPMPLPLEERLDWTCVPGARVGPIDRGTTYDALVELLGEEHLSETSINLGDGVTETGTRIFADSDREFIVRWEVYRQTPLSVTVFGPKWRTTEGIAVGTRASSLAALNGQPFSFYGFGWELGGEISSWNGGMLESTHALREQIRFTLSPRRPFVQSDLDQLSGSSEYSSDNEAVSRTNLHVSSMTVLINP